jgi:hypothetical protein
VQACQPMEGQLPVDTRDGLRLLVVFGWIGNAKFDKLETSNYIELYQYTIYPR